MKTVDRIDLITSKLDEIIFNHVEITHNIISSLYLKESIDYEYVKKKNITVDKLFSSIPDISFFSYKKIKNIKIINQLIFEIIIKKEENTEKSLSYFENLQKQILSEISSVKMELIGIKNNHDFLTKLPLRKLLIDKINHNKNKGIDFYISFIDIDHFKDINDIYGYDIGDNILTDISELISLEDYDVNAYRYGGEEFILLTYNNDKSSIKNKIDLIHKKIINHDFNYINNKKPITISSGTMKFNPFLSVSKNISTSSEIMRNAKNSGRNKALFNF